MPDKGRENQANDVCLETREQQVWDALDDGLVADAKTLIALQWLRRRLERKP